MVLDTLKILADIQEAAVISGAEHSISAHLTLNEELSRVVSGKERRPPEPVVPLLVLNPKRRTARLKIEG